MKEYIKNLTPGRRVFFSILLLYIVGRIGYFSYLWFIK
jgi:hypothetical protein